MITRFSTSAQKIAFSLFLKSSFTKLWLLFPSLHEKKKNVLLLFYFFFQNNFFVSFEFDSDANNDEVDDIRKENDNSVNDDEVDHDQHPKSVILCFVPPSFCLSFSLSVYWALSSSVKISPCLSVSHCVHCSFISRFFLVYWVWRQRRRQRCWKWRRQRRKQKQRNSY